MGDGGSGNKMVTREPLLFYAVPVKCAFFFQAKLVCCKPSNTFCSVVIILNTFCVYR